MEEKASWPTESVAVSAVKSTLSNFVPLKAEAPIEVIVWPPSKERVLACPPAPAVPKVKEVREEANHPCKPS